MKSCLAGGWWWSASPSRGAGSNGGKRVCKIIEAILDGLVYSLSSAKFDSHATESRYRQPASPLPLAEILLSTIQKQEKGNTNGRNRNSKVV